MKKELSITVNDIEKMTPDKVDELVSKKTKEILVNIQNCTNKIQEAKEAAEYAESMGTGNIFTRGKSGNTMKVNTNKANLLISAVRKEQYPATSMPEVAFIGRSNVGKSSMINKILNRKNFARVSATPGKTATINFYEIDEKLMLVDLPGYGYAAASKGERKSLSNVIGEYLTERKQLMQVVLLVDCRHKPTQDDIRMLESIKSAGGMAVVIATKADKLSKKALESNLEMIVETLNLQDGDVLFPFSTQTTDGVETFWDYIYDYILYDEDEEEGDEI